MIPPYTLLFAPLIFLMEFTLSVFLNKSSISILTMKPFRTVKLSTTSNVLYWVRFYIIGKISDWSIPLIVASILGDVLGDWWVANRKHKKKIVNQFPVNV